jgi:two-component sensor histidine kinase
MYRILLFLFFLLVMISDIAGQVPQKPKFQMENGKTPLHTIIFFSLVMLFIITGAAYYRYRNKRRRNFELQFQQIEISKQNMKIQGLILEKDKLATENDWLLKEVRHRVKNNLQIIMSLLNTQSAYLKNDAAIEAISDSQHRIHAISLIHQKLYNTSSVSKIDMTAYIGELVQYLGDCFDTAKRGIRFEQVIGPFEIELEQAIPVGLILNEAVTNAIKYAFDGPNGQIIIGLKLIGNDQVLLTLADNGKGLAADFDIENTATLGMEMIKALCKQLNGNFQVTSKNGVLMSITFKLEKTMDDMTDENLL